MFPVYKIYTVHIKTLVTAAVAGLQYRTNCVEGGPPMENYKHHYGF